MFSWFSFIAYTVIMAYTPGPINLMSMNNPKNRGLKNSIRFNLGNYAGHFMVMLGCLAFSKALYALIPRIQFPMKILGALYLTYIIYLMIKTAVPPANREAQGTGGGRIFLTGALLQFVNIKVILFGLTALSSYILPYYKSVPRLMLFALLMSSIQFTGNIAWTLCGSLLERLFNKHRTALNLIMAALLLYCAVRLFI